MGCSLTIATNLRMRYCPTTTYGGVALLTVLPASYLYAEKALLRLTTVHDRRTTLRAPIIARVDPVRGCIGHAAGDVGTGVDAFIL